MVIIDAEPPGNPKRWPILDVTPTYAIASLTCDVGGTAVVLTLNSTKVLKISAVDGLTLKQGSIDMESQSQLWLLGGGDLELGDGYAPAITFKGATSSESDRPQLVIGDGKTLTIFGGGKLVGPTTHGGLIRGDSGSGAETLIIYKDAESGIIMRGSFAIDTFFINNGIVKTDDSADGVANTIRLSCSPKMGLGVWWANGGESDYKSKIVVDSTLFASGNIRVENHGILEVNRPTSLYHGLLLNPGGKFTVLKNAQFDAARFFLRPADGVCPQEIEE